MENIDKIISLLTLEEKAELVSGYKSWMTYPIKRLNIPSIYLTDGPIGLRKKDESKSKDVLGLGSSCVSTSFPTSVCIANSWDNELAYKMGKAIGEECEAYNVQVILGPALNIKRDPRCGRNFEYYSEDPLLSGKIAGYFTKGVQQTNTAACAKHYAINNQENFRYMGTSNLDVRAAREIYLKSFENCIKVCMPKTIMCGYQKINGIHCSENSWLIKDILRNKFNFTGLVMTDWGATKDRVLGIKAGIDLDMPGGIINNKNQIIKAIKENKLKLNELNLAVKNVLNLVYSFKENKKFNEKEIEEVLKSHQDLALEIALESAVLLKNDNNILPIKQNEKILIVGELFEKMRYQGAGSSCMNPYNLITCKKAFDDANINYDYIKGYHEISDEIDENEEIKVINKLNDYDKVIFFGGLTELYESEGYDRKDLKLPKNQLSLIEKISSNNNLILVLFGGSPFEMPFVNKVKAILNMFLPGQAGGEAIRRLIFGLSNPCGKLSETWMKKTDFIYNHLQYSSKHVENYIENIYVGYRYYDEVPGKILFPFGFGLSYSKFLYSSLNIERKSNFINVSFLLTNDSNIDGKEIVQLYVGRNTNSSVFKAKKELKAYKKVFLKAHESKVVTLSFDVKETAYFNTLLDEFVVENGEYPIYVCSSSQDIALKGAIELYGYKTVDNPYSQEVINAYKNIKDEKIIDESIFMSTINSSQVNEPSKTPFTMETPIADFITTKSGKFVYNILMKVVAGKSKVSKKEKDEAIINQALKNQRFTMILVPKNSLRSLLQSSGGMLQFNLAKALLELANGHFFKCLKYLFKKEK